MYKKRIIIFTILILVLMSVISCYNINTYAKGKITYTLKNGTLTIDGKGMMPETKTYKNNKKIKKVIIKEGITSISDYAFENCINIKSVKLPKTIKRIGVFAFHNTNIKSLNIPNGIEVIGEGAFLTMEYIDKIKVPGHGYAIEPKRGLDPVMYEEEPYERSITFKAKHIEFKNSLPMLLNTLTLMDTSNFIVAKNDKNYSSKNGVIYTKDYSRTVRLPNRKKISICEGCKIFELKSIYYSYMEYYEGKQNFDYFRGIADGNNKKIRILILPKSLEYITDICADDRLDYNVIYKQSYNKK